MPRQPGIGKPNCPICMGTGWAPTAPILKAHKDDRAFVEYPAVRICDCRGGTPPPQDGPIINDGMKLDAQSRAAGETE